MTVSFEIANILFRPPDSPSAKRSHACYMSFRYQAERQGETLEQQIAKGPCDIRDALDIGRQVADGLEAAHEAGIVNRDIKQACRYRPSDGGRPARRRSDDSTIAD